MRGQMGTVSFNRLSWTVQVAIVVAMIRNRHSYFLLCWGSGKLRRDQKPYNSPYSVISG